MFQRILFLRYILLLLVGIFAGFYLPILEQRIAIPLLVGAIGLTLVFFNWKGSRHSFTKFFLLADLLVLGWFVANRHHQRLIHAINEVENASYIGFVATITSLPEKRKKSYRYEARVDELFLTSGSKTIFSKTLIYFRSDLEKLPRVGDKIFILGQLQRPRQVANTFQFDYRKYLERQGIAWTVYISDPNRFFYLPTTTRNQSLLFWPAYLSEKTDQIFEKYIPGQDAYGLTKAMILGRRDDIRAEINDAFVNSGTVHILSVSGLHVAIFFAVLHFILSPLKRYRWGTYPYLIAMILFLSAYALVTGMPASVQRAALMCILWLIASTFARKQIPLNTLAVAAFAILMGDPSSFYDIGFQLSFMAMLGIFLWNKPLLSLYDPKYKLTKHLWGVVVMSISAQLMTLPLTTYYFNQFPTYFLFANILAVDLSGLLIPASLALLLLGGIPWEKGAYLIGHLVNLIAEVVNLIVSLPEKMPYYLLTHLYLDLVQTLLLYVVLFLGYAVIIYRSKKWFIGLCAGVLVFSIYSSVLQVKYYRATFIESVSNESALIFKSRNLLYVFETTEKGLPSYEIEKYRAKYGKDTLYIPLF